jgi:hypothetical protein
VCEGILGIMGIYGEKGGHVCFEEVKGNEMDSKRKNRWADSPLVSPPPSSFVWLLIGAAKILGWGAMTGSLYLRGAEMY